MIVTPLAAESLGVRSMATFVECGATRVLIDPGAMLAPTRFNLAPAEEEWEALRRANDRISAYATRASLVFVSHYHEDHFRHDPGFYAGRPLWAKDSKRHVEGRQAQRAAALWRALKGHAEPLAAEGRRLETADAVLQASPPLGHGADGTALGYVVALTIEDRREGTRFVHASDVQGPLSPVAAAYLARQRPTLLYLSGPPAYLEAQIGSELIDRGIEHLLRIIDQTGCRVIFDHYALRDAAYPERFRRLWETGRVVTAAGYLGLVDAPLEARRLELWPGRRKPPMPVRSSRARGVAEAGGARPPARATFNPRPGLPRDLRSLRAARRRVPRALPAVVGDGPRGDRRRIPRPRGRAARGAPGRALAGTAEAADAGAALAGPWSGRGRRRAAARASDVQSRPGAAPGEGGITR